MGDKLFSHEYDFSYDSKRRFVSYWHQIREVISCDPLQVLEIGVGSGFVSRYLRGRGIAVKTVDIDASLEPDVVADGKKIEIFYLFFFFIFLF